jgi:hypothetical protein
MRITVILLMAIVTSAAPAIATEPGRNTLPGTECAV